MIEMDNISRKSAMPRFSQCILVFPERKKASGVKDPERQRNAEQNSADGCEREMHGRSSYAMA
jgi:hypothetical protein